MRCQLCDYNSDGPQSDYYRGLQRGGRRPIGVTYQPELDKYVCDNCWKISFAYIELEDNRNDSGWEYILDEEWDHVESIFEYVKKIGDEDSYD